MALCNVIALVMLATTSVEASVPSRDPKVELQREALIERGWDELHDLAYTDARATFQALQKLDPEAPRGYLYEAVALWLSELERLQELDLSRFIDSSHFGKEKRNQDIAETRRRFDELLSKAEASVERRLAEAPEVAETLYVLGSIHGTRAGFEATVARDTNAALRAAREAVAIQRRVIELDPELWDAYLPLGLYDYVTGSLPFYVKWIAYLAGYRGNKDYGIRKLELAARHGRTAARDAMAILSVIYVREGRLEDALRVLNELQERAPHNHVLRLNRGYCLLRLGRWLEAAGAYADAIAAARPGARFNRGEARLLQATALLQGGEARQALAIAERWSHEPLASAELETKARLLLGQCYDALGERSQAVALYRIIARSPDVDGSRSAARNLLRRPFVPATPPAEPGIPAP